MKQLIFLVLLIGMIAACSHDPKDYKSIVKKELNRQERFDSLFLGMYFQMPSKDFYMHCWELNKKGVLLDGTANATARYRLENELKYPASFEFYPKFIEDKIGSMPCFVMYDGWAPWNKHLSAEKLIEDVRAMLEQWYHIEFVPIVSPVKFGKAYLNITGNRKIILFYANDDRVEIQFIDLSKGEDKPNKLLTNTLPN